MNSLTPRCSVTADTELRELMSLTLSAPDEHLRARFFTLRTPRDVADLLEVTLATLTFHVYRSDPATRYTTFNVAKRRGGQRTIRAPASALKILQYKLNQVLRAVYAPRRAAHGFVRGRNIASNAQGHVRREWVLNVDLEDFFATINFGRVRGMFIGAPYNLPAPVATVLAQVCCSENQLPQGAPTSPIVSNMICSRLDSRLRRLAEHHRSFYTRYADDLTFSSHSKRFPRGLAKLDGSAAQIGEDLDRIIVQEGFVVNTRKLRLQHRYGRQQVTGLIVNDRINVDRRTVRQVRAMLHAWKKFGYNASEGQYHARWADYKHRNPASELPAFRNVIRGKLEFIGSIKGRADPVFVKLVARARNLDSEYFRTLSTYEDAVWVIHDLSEAVQGTGFYIADFGMITCAHVVPDDLVVVRKSERGSRIFHASVVRKDQVHDLAILSPNAPRLHTLKVGSSNSVSVGDEVTILGHPQWSEGQTLHVTRATVTGRRPVLGIDRIAVSSPIIPGNSGGPVLNGLGEVIGVAARGSDHFHPSNESAVIPIEAFLRLFDD